MAIPEAHRATPSGRLRARGLGVPFDGEPGALNAITDVAGVSVGYATLIEGDGALVVGRGPVRTGVTAILPRPLDQLHVPLFAGCFSLNGNGELTGTLWLEECGQLGWPITITNTHSCGLARDATLKWVRRASARPPRRRLWPAGRGRDLRRLAERHQRLPRPRAARLRGPGRGRRRAARGGQRRRRHRHDLLSVQGRVGHGIAPGRPR